MKKFNWTPVWEAIKEPLRILVLATIPFAISYFTETNYEWAVFATLLLRFLDKYLHEVGKKEKDESLEKGLTRF
jgi:hypothetical protein